MSSEFATNRMVCQEWCRCTSTSKFDGFLRTAPLVAIALAATCAEAVMSPISCQPHFQGLFNRDFGGARPLTLKSRRDLGQRLATMLKFRLCGRG
jgi:hypothetical protein